MTVPMWMFSELTTRTRSLEPTSETHVMLLIESLSFPCIRLKMQGNFGLESGEFVFFKIKSKSLPLMFIAANFTACVSNRLLSTVNSPLITESFAANSTTSSPSNSEEAAISNLSSITLLAVTCIPDTVSLCPVANRGKFKRLESSFADAHDSSKVAPEKYWSLTRFAPLLTHAPEAPEVSCDGAINHALSVSAVT